MFIIDSGKKVFVWIGSGASADEKKNAMTYAHVNYTKILLVYVDFMYVYDLELPDENKASLSSCDLSKGRK